MDDTNEYRNNHTAEASRDADTMTTGATQSSGEAGATSVRPLFAMQDLPDLRDTISSAGTPDGASPSHAEFTTVYDILDSLEEELDNAKTGLGFFSGTVKVDRERMQTQLDELKKMLPVQLERASALMREAERRLESAQTQANAIISSAQSRAADMVREANEQAQFLAGQENITNIARDRARDMLDQAQAKSDHLTRGADQYCVTVMEGLQQQLDKVSHDLQGGLQVLRDRQQAARQQLPSLDDEDIETTH